MPRTLRTVALTVDGPVVGQALNVRFKEAWVLSYGLSAVMHAELGDPILQGGGPEEPALHQGSPGPA